MCIPTYGRYTAIGWPANVVLRVFAGRSAFYCQEVGYKTGDGGKIAADLADPHVNSGPRARRCMQAVWTTDVPTRATPSLHAAKR